MTRIILRNANLVDGDNPPRRATVVLRGEHIEAVLSEPPEAGPGDRAIDLDGRTVMPGMVIGHYHASYKDIGAVPSPFGLEAPPSLQAMRAVKNFQLALECGFTAVISAGAPHGIDAAMKAAIEEGTMVGPRIMACGRDVGTTGHGNDISFPSYMEIGASGAVARCDGPEEFRKAVRQEIKDGSEIIKIFATGGHGTHQPAAQWQLSREELAAAIGAANERGAKARAHIANVDAMLFAIDQGIHILDHGDGFNDACIEKCLEHGTFLAPSLLFPKVMMTVAAGSAYAEGMRPDFDRMAAILPKANAAGVKIIIGDDYGAMGFPHGLYADELVLYVTEVGIPAIDVIRWATKNGAEAMGLGDTCGTIEPGKFADLLVIDGDPVSDIGILRDRDKLLAIFKGGVAFKDKLDPLQRSAAGSVWTQEAVGAPA